MKQKIIYFLKHPLISSSTIIFIGSFIANILNYVFNILIGRGLLTPEDYGLYSSLASVLVIFGLLAGTFINIFAKFAAMYSAKDDKFHLSTLFTLGNRYILLIGFFVTFLLILCVPLLSNFLHITNVWLLIITAFTIGVVVVSSLPVGIAQGQMRFLLFSFYTVLTPILKIIVALSLIYLGMKIFGVMVAVFLSSLIPFCFIFIAIKKNIVLANTQDKQTGILFLKEFRMYSWPFFLATFGFTILSSTDVLFARHFFNPTQAGYYAALSIMGKSIFYATQPLYFAFFPLIAQKKERKESLRNTLILGLSIIGGACSVLSIIYFIFPHVVLQIFFPKYSGLEQFLGPFSIFILTYSLASVLNNFLLAIGKTGIYKINLLVAFTFITLIMLFHQNFNQIIYDLTASSFLLLMSLLVYLKLNEHS